MRIINQLFSLIFCCIFHSACNKIKYYPDKPIDEVATKIIAHKAGGGSPNPNQENTLVAAKRSLGLVSGIEVDIQLSKDRTIWLSHNPNVVPCAAFSENCFVETKDEQIAIVDSCLGETFTYSRLDSIFAFMAQKYPSKYISLDVKAWKPCAVSSLNVPAVMNALADQIIALTIKYGLKNQVMVESETASFLNYIQNHSDGIACYLASLGDFERAMQLCLKSGFEGISFKYKFDEEIDADDIRLLHKKGVKIQLWTVNEPSLIEEALSINPDFIQTDNLEYFK